MTVNGEKGQISTMMSQQIVPQLLRTTGRIFSISMALPRLMKGGTTINWEQLMARPRLMERRPRLANWRIKGRRTSQNFDAALPETDGVPYQRAKDIHQNNNNQYKNGFLQCGSGDGGKNLNEAAEYKQKIPFEWINNDRDPRMNGLHPSESRDGGHHTRQASEFEFA